MYLPTTTFAADGSGSEAKLSFFGARTLTVGAI